MLFERMRQAILSVLVLQTHGGQSVPQPTTLEY